MSDERWICSSKKAPAMESTQSTHFAGAIMLASEQVEELICLLAGWNRQTLINQFQNFRSNFPVDMSPEFLATLTDDRMRHVFLALCLQNQRMPDSSMIAA